MEELMIEPHKMQMIKRIIDKYVEDELINVDLTRMESFYIHALMGHNGVSLAQLKKMVCFDKANTTRTIASLEKKGYITKVADASDMRKYNIFTTEKVEEVKKNIVSSRIKFNQLAFKDISEQDKKVFKNVIQKMLENIKLIDENLKN